MKVSFPTLITSRLILRRLRIEDASAIFNLRSNADVNRYLDRKPSHTIQDAKDFIGQMLSYDNLYWAITIKDNDEIIGSICLFNIVENNKAEIGFELLPQFQGQGSMKEATMELLSFAKKKLHLKIIKAETHKDNVASVRLLTKLGFSSVANESSNDSFQTYLLRLTS